MSSKHQSRSGGSSGLPGRVSAGEEALAFFFFLGLSLLPTVVLVTLGTASWFYLPYWLHVAVVVVLGGVFVITLKSPVLVV